MRSCLVAFLVCLVPAIAAAKTEIPVDVGIGPAAYYFFGPVNDPRWPIPHFGLKLNVYAVLDEEFLDRNRGRIPKAYKKAAESLTEVRITPSIFIPDALIISPKSSRFDGTGIYGITWRPLSLGVPL